MSTEKSIDPDAQVQEDGHDKRLLEMNWTADEEMKA